VVLVGAESGGTRTAGLPERNRRTARAHERLRIGFVPLHDRLAHTCSMINVQAGVVELHHRREAEQARTALANIRTPADEAMHEISLRLEVLRYGDDAAGGAPAGHPGGRAFDGLLRFRAGGLDVRTEITARVGPMPLAIDIAGYGIIQEAPHERDPSSQRARSKPSRIDTATTSWRGAQTTEGRCR